MSPPPAVKRPPAYAPVPGHYDEMVDAGGALRPHWETVTDALAAAGRHELNRRTQEARRLIPRQRHDVPRPQARGHPGTPLAARRGPLRHRRRRVDLERAVVQRARLYEAVLGDIYGPRRLIREGALPADWLHANPAFLRVVLREGAKSYV